MIIKNILLLAWKQQNHFLTNISKSSVLPKKDSYKAVEEISNPPSDDTIAFYFKEGAESFDSDQISYKGFQHASRYVKDVNSWVSEIWTSKLGPNVLITHNEHELDGETYGYILCYLVPEDRNTEVNLNGLGVDRDEL